MTRLLLLALAIVAPVLPLAVILFGIDWWLPWYLRTRLRHIAKWRDMPGKLWLWWLSSVVFGGAGLLIVFLSLAVTVLSQNYLKARLGRKIFSVISLVEILILVGTILAWLIYRKGRKVPFKREESAICGKEAG
ncbi:MAG: hypothetical protein ABSG14_01750 [Verrucomicrobiia bacterium]|jgi:amino acid transporter